MIRFKFTLIFYLGLLLLPLFAVTSCAADKYDNPPATAEFRGTISGKVAWVHSSKRWFMLTPNQWKADAEVAPATVEKIQAALKARKLKQIKIGATWKGAPDADQLAWIKALKPGEKVNVQVRARPTGELWLTQVPGDAAPTAAASKPAEPEESFPTRQSIKGAQVDETKIAKTIRVTPDNLRAGFEEALANLKAGTPTKIVMAAGTYRESLADLKWNVGAAKDTLLVIEGDPKGGTVWSGADVFEAARWTLVAPDKNIWAADWKYDFGNFSPSWGTPRLVGHRAEMVWRDGKPLMPTILEDYEISGMGNFGAKGPFYKYLALKDPAQTLDENAFGVAERDENGNRIWVRLAPGQKPADIEVAVRAQFLDFSEKNNLVIRDLTLEKVANTQREKSAANQGALTFGKFKSNGSSNVLLERVKVLWSSATGLRVNGRGWTLRDCEFSYNGLSGLVSGDARDMIFDGVTTNYNVWRGFLGGRNSWFVGGVKMHSTRGNWVKNHVAIGNLASGFWYDVGCGDIYMDDCAFVFNTRSLFWELSSGPFEGNRLILAGATTSRPGLKNPSGAFQSSIIAGMNLHNSIIYSDAAQDILGLQWYRRNDEHARREKLVPDVHRFSDNIILGGPNTDFLVHELNGIAQNNSRAGTDFEKFQLRGQNNIYFHPTKTAAFAYVDAKWKWHEVDLAAWSKSGRESGSRWQNPGFVAPEKFDFRLRPDSPLQADKKWPQYAMSEATRQQTANFFAWAGWDPTPAPKNAEKVNADIAGQNE